MLNLGRLKLLSELSVLGTVSAVAEAVHLTRPAVSQQLGLLERELDVALVERSGRNVELTPAGRRLVARSSELFRLVNDIEAEIAQGRQEISGVIRLASFGSAGVGLVPKCVQFIEQNHPQLAVSLIELEPAEGLKAAAANQVDVAIVDDMVDAEPFAEKLDFLPLCPDYFTVVMSSRHRLADRKNLQLSDLSDERWALNLAAISYHSFLMRAFHAAGFEPTVMSNCRNSAATLELVRASSVITVLPQLSLKQIMNDPDFTLVPIRPVLLRRIFTVVPKGASRRPSVAAVVDALQEVVPEDMGSMLLS
ncbi:MULTISPECIES: LysR family transcriptional regulator [Pseudomonas]|uniref:LysR family transcriptional regulator n=1 Tax=Pseudomonas monteilii TaxID=76759 RepID=A0AAE6RB93_9PSED|nr:MULTISPECIES: LysR family transcriptional regulator [Pseudomonas]NBB04693.1 LysR family transcriptional regulator [Pseudomonas monteilii]QHB27723.1 LysR family transcriptional regulator [Pseudomonas monteilii]SMD07642.1 DNA-binding transcriptional regulator, LysR family [Pseudomonas sp. URIL14HWK12:I5]SNB86079.1 DNA-binding transcriptional regulator, LysR family [Pseudomonas sp. URIL14HWK12:I8]